MKKSEEKVKKLWHKKKIQKINCENSKQKKKSRKFLKNKIKFPEKYGEKKIRAKIKKKKIKEKKLVRNSKKKIKVKSG